MPRGLHAPTLLALAFLLPLAGCQEEPARADGAAVSDRTADIPLGTGFDFYVLALSWSPGFCASAGDEADELQCGADADFGFIVHGLWPQYETGYPRDCATDRPREVSPSLIRSVLDIMPSYGLVQHEWQMHGTCSGLSQADYFATTRRAFDAIEVPATYPARDGSGRIDPDEMESSFIAANDGLTSTAIAVTCDRRHLRDVRICISRDLSDFVACPEVDRRACALDQAVMPPRH